jgi:hypothetical protein
MLRVPDRQQKIPNFGVFESKGKPCNPESWNIGVLEYCVYT